MEKPVIGSSNPSNPCKKMKQILNKLRILLSNRKSPYPLWVQVELELGPVRRR